MVARRVEQILIRGESLAVVHILGAGWEDLGVVDARVGGVLALIDLAIVDKGVILAAPLLQEIASIKACGHLSDIDLAVVGVQGHRRNRRHIIRLVATRHVSVRIVLALADAGCVEARVGTTHDLILLLQLEDLRLKPPTCIHVIVIRSLEILL